MLDSDEISVTAIPSCKRDRTIRDGDDGTSRRGAVIGGEMGTFDSEDWMHAPRRKSGGHARGELQRRCENGAFQGNTLLIVVRIVEEKPAIAVTGIHELGSLDFAVFNEIAVVR